MSGILNLQKNDILDLTKRDPSLDRIELGAGWDVAKKGFFGFGQKDFDLDLIAILLDSSNKLISKDSLIYYSNMRQKGIILHGDNRTGAGDGDDETISVSLNNLDANCHKVVFAVTIYDGIGRKQNFDQVKNAYIRLLDEDKGKNEICRFNLSSSAGEKTTLVFAELYREGSNWQFKAVGELLDTDIKGLTQKFI
ncbi:TerD family protein [uncultured Clostridium sp.]|jgi:tellurium resistance protein TerD|uniref:TerD family protein n=1 Tax=uncultured Clostridium sp. TaxID=59620 RepID=UPI002602F2EA|nr:TerD family protein [uncultured Clostridium sp.]